MFSHTGNKMYWLEHFYGHGLGKTFISLLSDKFLSCLKARLQMYHWKKLLNQNEGIVCLGVIRDFKIQRRDGNENV